MIGENGVSSRGNKMNIPNRENFLKGCEEYEKREKRDAMYKVATDLLRKFWGNPENRANALGVLLLTWNQAFYRYGAFDFNELEKCINDNFEKIVSFRNRKIFDLSDSDREDIKDLFKKFLDALQCDVIRFHENEKDITNLKEILEKLEVTFSGSNLETISKSIHSKYEANASVEFVKKKSNSKKDYFFFRISYFEEKEKIEIQSWGERKKLIRKSPVAVAKALHLLAPDFFPLWDMEIAQKNGYHYNKDPDEKYYNFCEGIRKIAEIVRTYSGTPNKPLLKLIDEYNYSKYTQEWIKN